VSKEGTPSLQLPRVEVEGARRPLEQAEMIIASDDLEKLAKSSWHPETMLAMEAQGSTPQPPTTTVATHASEVADLVNT
jgi:hypothetical protein